MDSTFEVRTPVNTIFLLTNLLLIMTGRTSANSVIPSFTHEVHQLLTRREGTPSLQMRRFRTAAASGTIWPAVPPREDHRAQSDSDTGEARNALTHEAENAAHSSTARRLLRDISPPGMWPPGADDYDEGLSSSRSLLSATSAAGHRKRPSAPFAERRSFTDESLVHGSARGRWQVSDSLSSESQPPVGNQQFRRHRQFQLASSRKRKS